MESNLWTDLAALERLARWERAAEQFSPRSTGSRRAGPPPPFRARKEFEIQAQELPARMVGGDYCDFFFITRDTLALVIADVSGKRVPAALLRGVAKSAVRELASSSSPGDTLTRVNRILYEASLGPMFVTIFLGWYHVPSGELSYASAGHPSPYRIDPRGRIVPFGPATGPILGILDLEAYAVGKERVEVGDRLVFYTDGVTEARGPGGEFFGHSRLRDLLAKHSHRSANSLCEAVVRGVDRFQRGQRQDYATLLVFHRRS